MALGMPVNPVDLLRAGEQLSKDRDRPASILFVIEPDAPDALLDAVQAAWQAKTTVASVDVRLTSDIHDGALLVIPDLAVFLLGTGSCARDAVESLRRAAVPTAALSLTRDCETVASAAGLAPENVFTGDDAYDVMRDKLGPWVIERTPGARVALAHNFPVLRPAAAAHTVRTTAWQNAAIGVVAFFPGADMPLMTANQAKMILQIAAVYGEPLGPERMRELAAVVGGAFMLRTIARQVVALVPGFGWALKGAIGYTGTIAMGKAASEYFEDGADIYTVLARLQIRAEEIRGEAAGMLDSEETRTVTAAARKAALSAAGHARNATSAASMAAKETVERAKTSLDSARGSSNRQPGYTSVATTVPTTTPRTEPSGATR
jgi:uncharacterized protein (DUF697 family)